MGTQNLFIHYQSYVHMYISANIPQIFTVPLSYYYIMTLSQSQVICDYWLIIEWSLEIITSTTTVNVNHKTIQANITLPFTVPLTYNCILTSSQPQIYATTYTYTYTDWLKTISGNNNLYYYGEYQPQQHL